MPAYKLTTPDGKSYKVTAASPEAAHAALQGMQAQQQGQQTQQELSDLSTNKDLQRQNMEKLNPTSKFESAVRGIGQGLTFGFGDEIGGALHDAGLQKEGTEAIRGGNEAASKANPWTYGAGEIGGAVGGAVALPAIAPFKGAGLAARAGNAVAEGGALSGAYGAGTATEGNRLQGALVGGGVGALTGGALGLGVGAVAGRRAAAKAAENIPATGELRAASSAAYKTADDAGITVAPESYETFTRKLAGSLKGEGLHPQIHPKAFAALQSIEDLNGAAPKSLQDLMNARRIASAAAKTLEPDDRRIAKLTVSHIDDYLDSLGAKDIASGNLEVGLTALKDARQKWATYRKSEAIDNLMKAAHDRASQFSGSGLENSIRTEFRAFIRNPRKMMGFSPEEQAAIRAVAHGTPINNVMRQLGKFAPTGVVSSVLGGGAGAALGGGVGAVALPAAGLAGRALATRGTKKAVERASQLVRGRGLQKVEADPETIQQLLQILSTVSRNGGLVGGAGTARLMDQSGGRAGTPAPLQLPAPAGSRTTR